MRGNCWQCADRGGLMGTGVILAALACQARSDKVLSVSEVRFITMMDKS